MDPDRMSNLIATARRHADSLLPSYAARYGASACIKLAVFFIQAHLFGGLELEQGRSLLIDVKGSSVNIRPYQSKPPRTKRRGENDGHSQPTA